MVNKDDDDEGVQTKQAHTQDRWQGDGWTPTIGSFWSDAPVVRSSGDELPGNRAALAPAMQDQSREPDLSPFETIYGDEDQDSSSGAPEGCWSLPPRAGLCDSAPIRA